MVGKYNNNNMNVVMLMLLLLCNNILTIQLSNSTVVTGTVATTTATVATTTATGVARIQTTTAGIQTTTTNGSTSVHSYSTSLQQQHQEQQQEEQKSKRQTTTTIRRKLLPPPLPFLPAWFNAQTLWPTTTNTTKTKFHLKKQNLTNITNEMLRKQEIKLTPLYKLIGKYKQQVSGVGISNMMGEGDRLSQVRLQYELSSGIDVPGYAPDVPQTDYSMLIPII
eukprot:GHVS01018523.1.p1 GENE.GHVS01018523.1~~GHVS01018523.1.p1  ORF type:complete len:223 (+),score=72.99 GHVS01018523.1:93-761(+)